MVGLRGDVGVRMTSASSLSWPWSSLYKFHSKADLRYGLEITVPRAFGPRAFGDAMRRVRLCFVDAATRGAVSPASS
jgi:hypothetical protein